VTARRTANALSLPDPIDAEHALGQLTEALVLSYAHDAAARTFVLITDYPDKAPGAARSFCALRFDGVDRFAREPGNLTELQAFARRYELTDGTRSIVVQALKTIGSGGTRTLEAWFGPNFGGLSFRFAAVTAFVRHTRTEERDGNWEYRDTRTGELVEFARPFAGARRW
jgi:hypothetical protein